VHPVVEGFVSLLVPSRCLACEQPSGSPFCEPCASLLDLADSPSAVFRYGGPIADAIHRFKYDGRSDFGAPLGALMAEAAARWAGRLDAVVPVPLHWRRRRWRGFDQAALLAKPVSRAMGARALLRGLRRTRHTPSQLELPRRERQRNVAGAFAPHRLRGARRVLLLDDVRTTGATLNAASSALREGGVSEVHTLVLAARVLCEST
jgi:ComF family protein